MTNWAYGVFLGLIFAAIIIGVLEWAGKDRKRVVHDAPMAPDNFTRKELKAAMAFPLRIKGYRNLEDWEIDLINTMKDYEEEIIGLIDAQFSTGGCNDRWLAIARTDLQKGFMALTRAIAQPESDDPDKWKFTRPKPQIDPPLADGPNLGAEIRKAGMTGDGEGLYD